ncbi:MAG: NAD(+) synthase [Gammaproteobacteria bacterium]|nr:NAD(+) synthase [Gammaproteobacteria bacterium]
MIAHTAVPDDLPTVALAQMEVRPGRPDCNVASMLEFIERARRARAAIVAFPEMCVPGYILGDAWEVDALVEDYESWSTAIRDASRGIAVVFGNVAIDRDAIGEDGRVRKLNAAWVCHDGHFVERADLPARLPHGVHPKTLHPNYRFFDDDRHFYSLRKIAGETGTRISDWTVPYEIPTERGVVRLGVQLCEDIWHQDYRDRHAPLDTLQAWHRAGADLVVNLSASPWTWQKDDKRNRVVREAMARSPVPFFYVNQVGAQNNGKNILVFDGDTCGYRTDGTIAGRAPPWREALLVLDGSPVAGRAATGAAPESARAAPVQEREAGDRTGGGTVQTEIEAIHDAIVTGLRHLDHLRGGVGRYLIGVSGGIDSSVVACMLRIAFGSGRVFAVNMPTRFNADVTRENARALCDALAVDYLSCPIEDLYDALSARIRDVEFASERGTYTRLVDENIQARIRGSDMLAGIAAKLGLVFTNNGNKTEVALGYATLYGDVNGAVAPIADLYKTQVFALARHLNETVFRREVVPRNLIDGETVPSAELSDAQDVTRGLGDPIKYGYHDALLRQLIEYRRHPLDILEWYRTGELLERIGWQDEQRFRAYFPETRTFVDDLEWVERQVRVNYFKRIQAPPIIVLSKRAFGFDLRESQLPAYSPRAYEQAKRALLGHR